VIHHGGGARGEFDSHFGHLPAPFAQGLGALDGLDFAGSVRLDTEVKNTNSVVVTPPYGMPMMLTYDQDIKLIGPADIAVRKMSDGSYYGFFRRHRRGIEGSEGPHRHK
jgi:hypothetical protein